MIEKPLLERVRVAVLVGLGYAVGYSVIAAALFKLKDPSQVERMGMSLPQAIATYWAGAVLGGVLVGILLPMARWRVGAFVLGTLGTLPFFMLVSLLIAADAPWFPDQVIMALLVSMVLGGLMGLYIRSNSDN
jgi:MFS family permease